MSACRMVKTMRFGNRFQLVLTIVALLGFNGPLCAIACSVGSDAPSELTAPMSAESHADCHGSGSSDSDKSQDERSQHDCELLCDASAAPSSFETSPEPTSASLELAVASSSVDAAARDQVLGVRPTRWEPPDRRRILLLKSSLQI